MINIANVNVTRFELHLVVSLPKFNQSASARCANMTHEEVACHEGWSGMELEWFDLAFLNVNKKI